MAQRVFAKFMQRSLNASLVILHSLRAFHGFADATVVWYAYSRDIHICIRWIYSNVFTHLWMCPPPPSSKIVLLNARWSLLIDRRTLRMCWELEM